MKYFIIYGDRFINPLDYGYILVEDICNGKLQLYDGVDYETAKRKVAYNNASVHWKIIDEPDAKRIIIKEALK